MRLPFSSTSLLIALFLSAAIAAVLWQLAGDTISLVQDEAELINATEEARVAEYHGFLLVDYDIDYRVATLAGGGDIDFAAVARFEELAATTTSDTGRGLLLMVDTISDRVRLEVGYALEGVFPDAFVAYVEQRQMVPFFEQGRVADGILATSELIIARAQGAAANRAFDEDDIVGSGGAGATTAARLGAGPRDDNHGSEINRLAGFSPEETLEQYFRAMDARNAQPDLSIYTPETRQMLRGWTMTPAQMDNVVRTYRGCGTEPPRVSDNGLRVVIRYPISERNCAPFFFQRTGDHWLLDLTMMQRAIRFGRTNAWRFDMSVEHEYGFGFEDWNFDSNGFPR